MRRLFINGEFRLTVIMQLSIDPRDTLSPEFSGELAFPTELLNLVEAKGVEIAQALKTLTQPTSHERPCVIIPELG